MLSLPDREVFDQSRDASVSSQADRASSATIPASQSTRTQRRSRNGRLSRRDVRSYDVGKKTLHRLVVGRLAMEYSTFAGDDRLDLTLVVYDPATPADKAKACSLIGAKASGRSSKG
jgi:hypothetical protein